MENLRNINVQLVVAFGLFHIIPASVKLAEYWLFPELF